MKKIKRLRRIDHDRIRVRNRAIYENVTTYKTGTRWHKLEFHNRVRNPTWNEMLDFLMKDDTDQIKYVEDEFMCMDFAVRVHNNARAAGLRSGIAILEFQDESSASHAVNVWNTSDAGMVFTESRSRNYIDGGDVPKSNDVIIVIRGDLTYYMINVDGWFIYHRGATEETIKKIIVIW